VARGAPAKVDDARPAERLGLRLDVPVHGLTQIDAQPTRQRALAHGKGSGIDGGHLGDPGPRPLVQLISRADFIHQTERLGARRAHRAPEQHHLGRALAPDQARHEVAPAGKPALRLGKPEARRVGREHEVAAQRQGSARSERVGLHEAENRPRRLDQVGIQAEDLGHVVAKPVDIVAAELLHVGARAEAAALGPDHERMRGRRTGKRA
jgi:hypothetical protein